MPAVASLDLKSPSEVRIPPRIYGHFAEHLGRCCYDGLWVGRDCNDIPHTEGFRNDVLEALKQMGIPLLRWPGGCYADHYHWRDGIGEPSARPRRLGLSCGLSVVDDNGLGTHEFLRLCELIGAEPYLAGNMGSGSVQEMCDWVEYCNSAVETNLVRERRGNGRNIPFGVRLWGVGNENWGCGGNYDPESYGLEYRRYATMLKHVDPDCELVVCGHDDSWNQRLIPVLERHANLIDHFSIHRYWVSGGSGQTFSEKEYTTSLQESEDTGEAIRQARRRLDKIDPDRRIGIALDEWGVWHPEARPWGPGGAGDLSGDYGQPCTQRDAILAAVALEQFHLNAEYLSLANLAQVVNVLQAPIQTAGLAMWVTPTWHLLRMHRVHFGARRVEASLTVSGSGAQVSALASLGSFGKCATVTNRSYSEPVQLTLPQWVESVELLSSEKPNSANSARFPSAVAVRNLARPSGGVLEMPPHSVAGLREMSVVRGR